MYDKLKFKAYATRDLNQAADRFQQQTGREAEVFVVRKDWEVYGSKENTKKVLVSRLAGFAAIHIPLYLNREQIELLGNARNESKMTGKNVDKIDEYVEKRMLAFTRYCNYCGRIYGTDPVEVVYHCSAPACVEKHDDYQQHRAEMKRLQGQNRPNGSGGGGGDTKKEGSKDIEKALDFSLDDPTSPTVMGWIYLIEAENGLYKIGRSDDVGKRFSDIVTISPVQIWLNHTIYCTNYVRAEAWIHKQFKNRRHHGEWFQLSGDEVEWIMNLEDHSLDRA